ncbi:sensor histidine kinase [Fontibacillus sp. BL9]|uniref:sensor histidine kinase n=1 Tax=Fontibacillus sp. BL9 TaxID=3389971 RepID=UPI00397DEAFE
MRQFLQNRHHYWIGLSILIIGILAVYIHAESIRYPYIGAVLERSAEDWAVKSVDASGKAASWQVQPGDRVIRIDGESPGERFDHDQVEHKSLVRATDVTFMRGDGTSYNILVKTETRDLLKILFSILMELLLLAIGLLAYRKNSGARLVRKFTAVNLVMALSILTLYSTEMKLSDFILSLCSIWLPYLLLSFCVGFVIRPVPVGLSKLLQVFRLFCMLFSCYALYGVTRDEIPGWIRETVQLVFLCSLVFTVITVMFCWKTIDRTEKNQALVLVTGLYLSLLPYIFLYALPDLIGGDHILSPEYALTGLVPLSATMMYVLGKRSILDMRLYLSRVLIHSVYFGSVFILFYLASSISKPGGLPVIFVVFIAVTYGYRICLKWSERNTKRRKEWVENQKLKLSIKLAEAQNIRDILNMLNEVIYSFMDVSGVCLLWHDGTRLLVQGSGEYKNLRLPNEEERPDPVFMQTHFDFSYLEPIHSGEAGRDFGYVCVGPKRNSSLLSPEERKLIDSVRVEALRLLTNAGQLAGLRREFQLMKAENAAYERRVSDIRFENRILLEAQQAERIRTSYFLHDHLLQNLIYLSRDLEELADGGKPGNHRVETWLKCLYDSQREIRSMCDELYPHVVDKAGLEESLNWLMRSCREKGLEAELKYEWAPALPPNHLLKTNLFRMIRELTNNVIKHAEATRLEVHVRCRLEKGIYCKVSDNGRGFNPADLYHRGNAQESKHFGLISVSNQIGYLGGELDIHSVPGEGTVVTLKLLQNEGEEYYGKPGQGSSAG